jgi:hypothetical protein
MFFFLILGKFHTDENSFNYNEEIELAGGL